MTTRWIEWLTGSLEQKKRYNGYKARKAQLPANYRTAIEAVDRYLMGSGSITRGETLLSMLDDLIDLFEQSAANETPIKTIVGDDPIVFAEAFLENYAEGHWNDDERKRLAAAIDRAADGET